ncbi:MAG: thiamine pyrophosphate-dependent enzyme [Acidiferrobacterales bacterium]
MSKFSKNGMRIDIPIGADAKDFFLEINKHLKGLRKQDISCWWEMVAGWKKKYPVIRPEYSTRNSLNPYVFVKALADAASAGDIIFVDAGCVTPWMSQSFEFKEGQRYFHAFNHFSMGYALPAAMGASIALDRKPVICVSGDGGLQMNIQELATVIRYDLPIKIFIVNNHGYGMIQQTQDQWLGSRYLASSIEGGLAEPDLVIVAKAYGFMTYNLTTNQEVQRQIAKVLAEPGQVFCNVEIRPEERVIPQVKFGRPIEDAEPLLERQEFFENMIVEPLDASRK